MKEKIEAEITVGEKKLRENAICYHGYRGSIGSSSRDLPRIKLDLTVDELLVLPPAAS